IRAAPPRRLETMPTDSDRLGFVEMFHPDEEPRLRTVNLLSARSNRGTLDADSDPTADFWEQPNIWQRIKSRQLTEGPYAKLLIFWRHPQVILVKPTVGF